MAAVARSFQEFRDKHQLDRAEADRIARFDELLLNTQAHTNLIARTSIDDRWTRHYLDSAQLFDLVPDTTAEWLDVGSGAGFPGLVLAVMAQDRCPAAHFTLCDSVKKKAAFLRDAVEKMELTNVTIIDDRVEMFHVKHKKYHFISARAVTALPRLLELTAPLLKPNGLLVFPKGERADEEMQAAQEQWTFEAESRPSMTHDRAKVLLIKHPERRQ